MKMKVLYMGCLMALALATPILAKGIKIERKPLQVNGAWEVGQAMKLAWEEVQDSNQVIQRVSIGFLQQTTVNDRLNLYLGIGGLFFNPYPAIVGQWGSQRRYFATALTQARALYSFGDLENPSFQINLGFFGYKYNPDAKNLGEYLFRSSAYPNFIRTGGYEIINSAAAAMQGLQLIHNMGPFTHNLFLTTETEFAPLHDFSLSYVASMKVGSVLDLGAGVNFNRLIPVRPSLESRKLNENSYIVGADTLHYTFQSTKLMGRASFDPKGYFGESALFGQEDLKLYSEVAVLGVKNYPKYYEKIADRTPIMVGFNIPTFNLLDVFSVEYERYTNPYPNDWFQVLRNSYPIPYQKDSTDFTKTKYKWSLYARKTITPGFGMLAQVASDHFRTLDNEWQPNHREVVTDKDHWYYMIKFNFGI